MQTYLGSAEDTEQFGAELFKTLPAKSLIFYRAI